MQKIDTWVIWFERISNKHAENTVEPALKNH